MIGIVEGLEAHRITSYNVCYTKLLRADAAMYEAKAKGRNHSRIYRPDYDSRLVDDGSQDDGSS